MLPKLSGIRSGPQVFEETKSLFQPKIKLIPSLFLKMNKKGILFRNFL
jgi:hypothetical protein